MNNAEQKCSCESCEPNTIDNMRMIVCETCGNKRCPHATDHRNPCTNSNAVGQKGSSWEHVVPLSGVKYAAPCGYQKERDGCCHRTVIERCSDCAYK